MHQRGTVPRKEPLPLTGQMPPLRRTCSRMVSSGTSVCILGVSQPCAAGDFASCCLIGFAWLPTTARYRPPSVLAAPGVRTLKLTVWASVQVSKGLEQVWRQQGLVKQWKGNA